MRVAFNSNNNCIAQDVAERSFMAQQSLYQHTAIRTLAFLSMGPRMKLIELDKYFHI